MGKFKVYKAGKMGGLTLEQMNTWRIEARELFKQYSDDILTINPVEFYNFELDKDTYTEHEIKFFDLHQVKNSNVVLLNLDYPDSIGTAIEVHMGHDEWKIPVIAFGGEGVFVHPWIELSVTKRCKTLEEAVEHIIEFYFVNR